MERVVGYIRATHPGATVVPEKDPARLRYRLLCEIPGRTSAIIGELGQGIAPINVAACLVADGHTHEVVLACSEASGSLRSRAAQAGVSQVVVYSEMPLEARIPASAAHGAPQKQPFALDDMDEPEFLDAKGAQGNAPTENSQDKGATHEQRQAEPPGPTANTSAGCDLRGMPQIPALGCPVLCVASGRGGVGKSATAALMALAAARWGMRVALVDLDLASGNLYTYFGLSKSQDLGRLGALEAVGAQDVERLRVRINDRLALWGPLERPEMAETLTWRTTRLIELVSHTSDLVIIDTSTSVTDAVAQALQASDRVLLVADERQGAIGSLSRAAALVVRLGVARTRIVRVMNRCESRRRDDALAYAGQVGLETARCVRLLEGDEEVTEMLAAGQVAELARLDNDFSESAAHLIASMLSELGQMPDSEEARKLLKRAERKRRGLFGRMREAG